MVFGMLILLAASTRIATLPAYPLMDTTESRYAEIAREMAASGDWIMPRIDDQPFWSKPPLSFWATALSFKALGISEFSARLSSFLMMAVAGIFTFILGRKLHGTAFGLLTAAILSTGGLFYVLAGGVMTDPALVATVTTAMVAFAMTLLAETPRGRRAWGLTFFLGLGLSVLAKGPVGICLVIIAIGAWVIRRRQWARVRASLPWGPGLLLMLAVGAPWFLIAEWKTPGFLQYYIIGEHFSRFTVSHWGGDLYGSPHTAPFGTIWVYWLIGAMPWGILLLPAAAGLVRRSAPQADDEDRDWLLFALCWSFAPVILFTFSRNIMIPYVAPGLPGFALMAALLIKRTARAADAGQMRLRYMPALLVVFSLATPLIYCAAIPIIQRMAEERSQKSLVRAFESHSPSKHSDLLYIDRVPHSATFYSGGRTKAIKGNGAVWRAEFQDGDTDYFAVRDKRHSNIADTEEVGRFGVYLLLRERVKPGSSKVKADAPATSRPLAESGTGW
jgi:4-amino-4-deoxy-L-arabinose transferase-like glycosyltransferase